MFKKMFAPKYLCFRMPTYHINRKMNINAGSKLMFAFKYFAYKPKNKHQRVFKQMFASKYFCLRMATQHIRHKTHISACSKTMFAQINQTDTFYHQTHKLEYTRIRRNKTYANLIIADVCVEIKCVSARRPRV